MWHGLAHSLTDSLTDLNHGYAHEPTHSRLYSWVLSRAHLLTDVRALTPPLEVCTILSLLNSEAFADG